MAKDPRWREKLKLQAVANRIIDKCYGRGFQSLDEAERVFFCVWIADAEVKNGGMHAVCFNPTGDYLMDLPPAFDSIGARTRANLFRRLIDAFPREMPSRDHEKRMQQHAGLSEKTVEQISFLDDEYNDCPEDVEYLLYKFWFDSGWDRS